jgi:Planctomycete cytochrome C
MNYTAVIAGIAIIFFTLTASKTKDAPKTAASISFSKDVMPVLTKKCLDCHTTEDESSNHFNVDTYEALIKDSKHGPSILPGKGEKSMIITKMRGTADFGSRMPKRGSLVPDSVITIISKWIDQGAKKN